MPRRNPVQTTETTETAVTEEVVTTEAEIIEMVAEEVAASEPVIEEVITEPVEIVSDAKTDALENVEVAEKPAETHPTFHEPTTAQTVVAQKIIEARTKGWGSISMDTNEFINEKTLEEIKETLALSGITFEIYSKNGVDKVQFNW